MLDRAEYVQTLKSSTDIQDRRRLPGSHLQQWLSSAASSRGVSATLRIHEIAQVSEGRRDPHNSFPTGADQNWRPAGLRRVR